MALKRPAPTGSITEFRGAWRFLSNFSPSPVHAIWVDNEHTQRKLVPTVEHAYQASKCARFEEWDRVASAASPQQAKRLGGGVELTDGWDAIQVPIMRVLLQEKFTRHPALGMLLLQTGTCGLIEGNTWGDRFWGATLEDRPDPGLPSQRAGEDTYWVGENWLGRLLLEQREELRK